VNAGSFVAAARELGVSPPAVTHMIAALEQDSGLRCCGAILAISAYARWRAVPPGRHDALTELHAAEARLSVNRTRGRASWSSASAGR